MTPRVGIVLYLILLGTFIPAAIAYHTSGEDTSGSIEIALSLLDAILVVAVFLMYLPQLRYLLRLPKESRWFGIAALAVIPSVIAAWGLSSLFLQMFPSLDSDMLMPECSWGVRILFISIFPAVFEELAFRGVIYESMKGILKPTEVLWVTSLMFCIIHLGLFSIVTLLTTSLILCWLRKRSGSIYPSMLLHFLHNTVILLLDAWGL